MKYIHKLEDFDFNEFINSQLFYAINVINITKIEELINKGEVDINASTNDYYKDTPLIKAIYTKNNLEITKILIEAGADINKGDFENVTPLMCAVINAQKDIIDYLITKNADVNLQTKHGDTALILASQGISHTTEWGAPDKAGWTTTGTPLIEMEIIRELIDAGADMFFKNGNDKDFYDILKIKNNKKVMEQVEEEYPEFVAAKKYNL